MDLLLASGNEHKAKEFSALFSSNIINVSPAPRKIEVVEDGVTFRANALLKAKNYYEEFKKPVMADDSGLCVSSMPDELGIHTARFGGEGLTSEERCLLLLKKMKGIEDRSAFFVCVLCFYLGPAEIFYFEGRLNGKIDHELRGKDGFGYDPVFIPEKADGLSTLAMIPEWKNENSHRAVSCAAAETFFKKRNCQKP